VVERQVVEALARRGVRLLSLAEAVAEHPELVETHLSTLEGRPGESKFAALAAALWDDGALLYLPRGVAVKSPIEISRWDAGSGPSLTRTLVVAEEGSEAAVVETFGGPADRPESLCSGLVDLVVGAGARVMSVQVQERDQQAWSFSTLRSAQEQDSAATWLLLGLGSRTSRTELSAVLDGQGAEADLIGLVFGAGRQHFDFETLQDHVGSDTRSDLLLKVALRDRASSTFTGLIRVGHSALRTASNQENRNLLLSGEAKADSDPKLEILNSDVARCGHGATVGPVDQEQVFYLMTRGLSREAAERLIVEGFFEPLLARVPLAGVHERLVSAVERKLGR
jgi:Fe-S cluster assembly protein SufD